MPWLKCHGLKRLFCVLSICVGIENEGERALDRYRFGAINKRNGGVGDENERKYNVNCKGKALIISYCWWRAI